MTGKHWMDDVEIIHDHERAAIKELIERRNRDAAAAIRRDKENAEQDDGLSRACGPEDK